jgi:hypothetical protein
MNLQEFTIDVMLKELGLRLDIFGFDKDLQRWAEN